MGRRLLKAAAVALPLIWLAAGLARGSETPHGHPQTLRPHKPAMAAPLSSLPPVSLHPNAAEGLARAYGGAPIDVTNYHYDNYRTGWNPNETDLTPATVGSGNFGLLATLPVDGNVYAQPLLLTHVTMPDKLSHDVLVVATGNNSVYAYDAHSYALLWQVNLGKQQSTNDVGCGDVYVGYGVSSTPVIVRSGAGGTIYVVSAIEPTPYEFHSMLHALDITTGLDLRPPVEINPSVKLRNKSTLAFDPQNQWNRASLAYNPVNGSLYIGIGSHCDNNAYNISGWLLRYDTASLTLQKAFNTIAYPGGYELSSIWMTGFAPAIDPAGNVFVVTGNGDFTGPTSSTNPSGGDWGESVLKFAPDLSKVTTFFTPAQYNNLNNWDADFGSGGVMLLPPPAGAATPLATAMGKAGNLYLLKQAALGKLAPNDTGAQDIQSLGGGLWGGPAYYNGPGGPTVFAQVNGDVLRSFSVAAPTKSLHGVPGNPKWHYVRGATGATGAGYGGSLPIVSSNGAAAGTGVVWLVRRSAPIELEAYDATNLGNPIYSANIGGWSNPYDNNPFLSAMEANGRVYVGSYLTVRVFGLTQ